MVVEAGAEQRKKEEEEEKEGRMRGSGEGVGGGGRGRGGGIRGRRRRRDAPEQQPPLRQTWNLHKHVIQNLNDLPVSDKGKTNFYLSCSLTLRVLGPILIFNLARFFFAERKYIIT